MIIKIIILLLLDNSTVAVVAGTVWFVWFYTQTAIFICNPFGLWNPEYKVYNL